MTGSMQLLDELQKRGFTPDDSGAPWFDLHIGGNGTLAVPRAKIRAHLDDVMINIYIMTGNGVIEWDARLSHAPMSVITTVIDLAIASAYTAP
jgi:hypothetical protein